MQIACALLRAGAPSNVAMIQSAIDANNLELLQLLVNNSGSLIANEFIPLLQFNLQKQTITLTAEMVQALKLPYKNTQGNAKRVNIASEYFAHLSPGLIGELFDYISDGSINDLLEYAVKKESTELASALLSHSNFPERTLHISIVRRISLSGQGPVPKGVVGLIFAKQFECFIDRRYLRIIRYEMELSVDNNATYRCLTQESVAAYLLARAQDLPQNSQSIALIQKDLKEIKNPDSILHIFLRGHVIGRLRKKLVADLEGEMAKREKALQASANEGTSSRVTYLAPVPLSSVVEDLELQDLNPERTKANTSGLDF